MQDADGERYTVHRGAVTAAVAAVDDLHRVLSAEYTAPSRGGGRVRRAGPVAAEWHCASMHSTYNI